MLLNIIKQTYLQSDQDYPSVLRINGRYANAGDPRSLFHCGDTDKLIRIRIGFQTSNFYGKLEELALEFQNHVAQYASAVFEIAVHSNAQAVPQQSKASIDPYKQFRALADELFYQSEVDFDKTRALLESIVKLNLGRTEHQRLERILGPGIGRRPNRQFAYKLFFGELNSSAGATLDLLQKLRAVAPDSDAEIQFDLGLEGESLTFSSCSFSVSDKMIFEVNIANRQTTKLTSDLIPSPHFSPVLG